MSLPSQSRLKELFDYCPTGQLIRKISAAPNAKAGSVAGYLRADNRFFTSVDGKKYRNHRLVWAWHFGAAPDLIDHINRDSSDNRVENLRACRHDQNGWNAKLSIANTSGVKGVSWNKRNNNWRVRVRASGVNHEIGSFDDFELAELVMLEARDKYHGQFATKF